MTKPIIRIHNTETNEVIDREMTNQEFTQYQADEAAYAARLADAETKATARQAVLNRLGLTEEEAQLIIGGSN
jgi:hypothetical protein